MIKKYIILLLVSVLMPVAVSAQKPSSRERESWMREMQQVKNDYIARKLCLSEEQKEKFFPLYTRMDAEVREVTEQVMRMEMDVRKKGDDATDLECEKAAEALFELKGKEARIELKYLKNFKSILTPKQLLDLKKAERDFSKDLMKKHREKRKSRK